MPATRRCGTPPPSLARRSRRYRSVSSSSAGVVVRRLVRVALQLLVADRDPQAVAQQLEVLERQLLHLVRRVAAGEVRPEPVALDGLGQDDGRLAGVLHRRLVRRVDLAVVVAAALELPDVVVRHVLDHPCGARVAAEEVLLDVGAVVRRGRSGSRRPGVKFIRLTRAPSRSAASSGSHSRPQTTLMTFQPAPRKNASSSWMILPLPRTGPSRRCRLQLTTKVRLSSSSNGGDVQQPAALRLVHLAVAEERPDVLLAGVLDAARVQVLVELRLVDRVHRAEAHRHRRELPEVRHQPRVRVRRQPAARVRDLLAEAVELVLGEPALEVGPGVDAGGGVALDVDLVAAALGVLAAEEVVEADLVERGRRRVRRDVAADADARPLGAVHHDRGVPAQPGAVAALDLLVTGEPGLVLGRDRVDVVGGGQARDAHLALAGALVELEHQVAGAGPAALVDDAVERVQPLLGLVRVDVRAAGSGSR